MTHRTALLARVAWPLALVFGGTLACDRGFLDPIGLLREGGTPGACPPSTFVTSSLRTNTSGQGVAGGLNHAASVLLENGVYRMWWCAYVRSEAGQHILYAESRSLDGPWHSHGSATPGTFDVALAPTEDPNDVVNDSRDVCQPSVVRSGSAYYLYYHSSPNGDDSACGSADGGAYIPHAFSSIRVATGSDGLTWQVENGHAAIVTPVHEDCAHVGSFGAGRPSVIALDGLLYLAYADSTGDDNPAGIGAAQYVLRSADPLFQTGVEELTADGFVPRTASNHATHIFMATQTIDWQYSDEAALFIVVSPVGGADVNGVNSGIAIDLFSRDRMQLESHLVLDAASYDAPGVVSTPDRHAVAAASCTDTPVDMMRATYEPVLGFALMHEGADVRASGCVCDGSDL